MITPGDFEDDKGLNNAVHIETLMKAVTDDQYSISRKISGGDNETVKKVVLELES